MPSSPVRWILGVCLLTAGSAFAEPPPLPCPPAVERGGEIVEAPPADAAASPCRANWLRYLQTIRWGVPDVPSSAPGLFDGKCACDLFNSRFGDNTCLCLDGVVRGYWLNDQRIEWSGVESVLGAEAIVRPSVYHRVDDWVVSAEGEFFINQPFGKSILRDPERDVYRSNFEVDIFQVFQLYAQVNWGDAYLRIGKSRTPFGAYSSPMFTNRLIDAPFIRTEVIQWTETGAFFHYQPGWLSLDIAITNGEPDLDTNSSKAVIGRLGVETATWGVGISGKYHDGISSEFQKRYNNHVGVDAHVCLFERFVVYGEGIYDEYGFHRNFFKLGSHNPDTLGPRSIYRREVFKGDKSPVIGWGYYVAVGYHGDAFLADVSYGSYTPEKLGVLGHDAATQRTVVKLAYNLLTNLQIYGVAIIENRRDNIELLANSYPHGYLAGMQFLF